MALPPALPHKLVLRMAQSSKPVPLAPVLLVNFIGTMGFTIVIPFLVFLVTRFGGNALVYGLVAATYPAFQFVAAPVLGRWSDRYGRRRILLLSEIGTFVSWLVFALALFLPPKELFTVDSATFGRFTMTVPLVVIFVARALDGLTGGNISVANAYVADVSPPEKRNRNFGRMGVAANLGMIMGPALASVLGVTVHAEVLPVFAAAIIALVGVGVIAFGLPESNRFQGLPECPRQEKGKVLGQEIRDCMVAAKTRETSVREVLSQPNVAFMMVLYFTILLSFNFYYTAFPMHASLGLGWDVTDIGAFFATLSLMIVVVEGPVLARLAVNCLDGFESRRRPLPRRDPGHRRQRGQPRQHRRPGDGRCRVQRHRCRHVPNLRWHRLRIVRASAQAPADPAGERALGSVLGRR